MKIMQFPLARFTLFFVCGIVIARTEALELRSVIPSLVITFILLLITYFLALNHHRIHLLFGFVTALFAISTGITTQLLHSDTSRADHYLNFVDDSRMNTLEVVLREQYKTTARNERFVAAVQRINGLPSQGLLLLNIRKDTLETIPIGTVLYLKSDVVRHQPPRNPGQFDYGQYLQNKNIAAQVFTNRNEIAIGTKIQKTIWYYAARLRNTMLSNLRLSGFQKRELNVLAALILGQQQDISPEILRDYQYAGAVHILSVSGLHVGFILLFINFLLRPFPNTRAGSGVKIIVLLVALWSFAVLAGLSPSVVRSVTMFSFVAIGMHLRRPTNIFHTLLVSVFLILLFQPSFLTDVGFQLSYVALFFILWLQPLFSSIWDPQNKIVKYLWDILTVSFAAQIGSFPLSAYYFHQFAGLFFLTNLVIIPFLSIIMAIGVTVVVIAMFGTVPFGLALVLQTCISILNTIIAKIASFEQFVIQGIQFNKILLVMTYLLIIATFTWFEKPKFVRFRYVLLLVLAVQISYLHTAITSRQRSELIVFNWPRKTLITQNRNAAANVYCSDTAVHDNSMLKSYLLDNFSTVKSISRVPNVLQWHNKNILIIDSAAIVPPNADADVLVLIQSPRLNLDRLLKNSKPDVVVADASSYKSYIASWKRSCEKQKIPFHATGEKEFFRIK